MKRSLYCMFTALALFQGGCATQPKHPDWIEGDSAKYSNAQFLLGRGQAATMAGAKDRARIDLEKKLQVPVSLESESARNMNPHTARHMEGMQFAELWQDPRTKNFHILATIPRLQVEADLSQKITQLDDATQVSLDQSKSNSDPLLKIAAINNSLELQVERDSLQKMLQVVDIKGRGIASKFKSGTLKAEIADLLKQVRFVSQVLDGSVPGLEGKLVDALSQAGFMVDSREKSNFLLKASFKLTNLVRKEGKYWQSGNLEISVSDMATGRVRGSQRWPIKGVATEKHSALTRALEEVDAILKQELGATIIGMAHTK